MEYKETKEEREERHFSWYELNAKLQQKKHHVRERIKEMGVLQKKGKNDFDHYKYFSEAQAKELFTEMFTEARLELTPDTEAVTEYEGTPKQPFGRQVRIKYTLHDIDTGFSEVAHFVGEGLDKGDKGIYKAYTGSLKYYLANTFMAATGDDPEVPDKEVEKKITAAKAKTLGKLIEEYGVDLEVILETYEHKTLEDFTAGEYANCLKRLEATKKKKEEADA